MQHPLSLCFLAPGIYTLYAYDVQLSNQTASQDNMSQRSFGTPVQVNFAGVTAVNAAYFLVE